MKTILIVEDDNFIGKILKGKLLANQYETELVTSAERALESLKTSPPDLILLDILLPGMNGLDLLALIRQTPDTKKIPVMIISNLNDQSQMQKAATLGITHFILKATTTTKEILNKIEEHFRPAQ